MSNFGVSDYLWHFHFICQVIAAALRVYLESHAGP